MFVYIQLGRWHFVGACFSYCQNSGRRTDCRTPTDSLQPCSVLAQPLLVTFSHPGRTIAKQYFEKVGMKHVTILAADGALEAAPQ
eukprot:706189-Pyramimonas_sp.AAC.1